MPAQPDLAGVQDALGRLREATGEDVPFFFAATDTWPTGTVLNPDTGRPYDPLIEPEKEESPEPVEVRCSVAFRPGFQEDADETEIGDIKMNVVLLGMDIADWPKVEDAVSFNCKGDNYVIKKSTDDGIGSDYRRLVWGERQGEPWA